MTEIKYREEQKLIMGYNSGKLAIPAVPGAGKTFITTRLASKLVKNLGENEEILILTYMNSSVNNFKYRILEILRDRGKSEDIRRFQIKTIHKLGSEILREYGERIGVSSNFQTITDSQKFNLMNLVLMEYRREKSSELNFFIDPKKLGKGIENKWDRELINLSIRAMGFIKTHGISAKQLYFKSKKYKRESLLKIVGEIYYRFDKKCKEEGFLDYDDILFYTYKLLKGDLKLTEELRKKYKYILEDEAQDSNILQNKIINLISNGNLVKVGDPNQSILGTFTSSSPEIFKKFIGNNFKIEMFRASRSKLDIIEVANYLVSLVTKKHPLEEARKGLLPQIIKLVSEEEKEKFRERVWVKRSLEEKEELENALKAIKQFQKKYPEQTVGVLFPNNYLLREFAQKLRRDRINFQILSDIPESLLDILNFLGDFLGFLARPFEGLKFLNLLLNNFFMEDKTISEILKKYIKNKPMEDIIYGEELPELDEENLKKYKNILKKIRATLEFSQNSVEKIVIFIGEVFEVQKEKKLLLEKISYDLKKILKYNPKWSLMDISINLKKSQNNEFMYLAKSVEEEMEILRNEDHKITLSTYHRSKGMEWDLVYLIGVDNHRFPINLREVNYGQVGYLKKEYQYPIVYIEREFQEEFLRLNEKVTVNKMKLENIMESARLLYVGITRAKKYLILDGNIGNGSYYLDEIEKYLKRGDLIAGK
jgi:DNA helicase-2/ATP-dependent DNA helicase PcrA